MGYALMNLFIDFFSKKWAVLLLFICILYLIGRIRGEGLEGAIGAIFSLIIVAGVLWASLAIIDYFW